MNTTEEQRVRRVSKRRGYMLRRTRRFDQRAIDFGTYRIIDRDTDKTVFPPPGKIATLQECEAWLEAQPKKEVKGR